MKKKPKHLQISLFIIIFGASFWTGRLSLQYQIASALPPVRSVSEINPGVPVVTILDIQYGKITGEVNRPSVRVRSGNQVAVPDQDLQFSLSIEHLGYLGTKVPVIDHHIPDWAQFVASKNGKYFYALDEKQAKRLSVPNRVYFVTSEEASAAGYLKR